MSTLVERLREQAVANASHELGRGAREAAIMIAARASFEWEAADRIEALEAEREWRPIDFAALRIANAARQAEWDTGNQITLTFRSTELAGEVGEACNVIKKLARERMGIRGSRATVQDLADEIADVIICADLIAMDEDIDLGEAVARKFNATSEKVGLATCLPAPPAAREEHQP